MLKVGRRTLQSNHERHVDLNKRSSRGGDDWTMACVDVGFQ